MAFTTSLLFLITQSPNYFLTELKFLNVVLEALFSSLSSERLFSRFAVGPCGWEAVESVRRASGMGW